MSRRQPHYPSVVMAHKRCSARVPLSPGLRYFSSSIPETHGQRTAGVLGRRGSWSLTPQVSAPCGWKYHYCRRLIPVLFGPSAALSVGQDFPLAVTAGLPHSGACSWLFDRKTSSFERQTPRSTWFPSLEVYTSCPPELWSDFAGFLGFCLWLFL